MNSIIKKTATAILLCLISISYGYAQQNITHQWEATGKFITTGASKPMEEVIAAASVSTNWSLMKKTCINPLE